MPSDDRLQAKRFDTGPLILLLVSAMAAFPGVFLAELTIGGEALMYAGGLLGLALVGLPLCWAFRGARYYGKEFIMERLLVWFIILSTMGVNGATMAILLNRFCGDKNPRDLAALNLGSKWDRRHGTYRLFFKVADPSLPRETILLKPGEDQRFKDAKTIVFQVYKGWFGFPVILQYRAGTTNSH